ncbi:putative ribonuclease H-like domain-containing protein [Tanacetum coccineum]
MKDQATPKVNRKNWNAMMEREQGEVWTNANRVNHSNKFVPRSVQLNVGRPNTNSVRPNINTGRTNINSVRPRVNAVSSNVNTVRSRQPIENQLNHRVKIIRSDNGTKFKNRNMLEFCGNKGIKQEYSNARTPQQNGVAKRMNRTLIEAARTMLADSLLPTTFWAEAVSIACYIFNRMFDIEYLTDSMKYIHVSLENQANPHAGTSEVTNSACTSQTPNANASEEKDEDAELILVPSAVKNTAEKVETRKSSTNSKKEEILTEPQQEKEASSTDISEANPRILAFRRELEEIAQKHSGTVPENNSTSTLSVNSGSEPVNTGELDPDDSAMPELEIFHKPETGIFDEASYDEEGVVTDFNSLPTVIEVSPTPTLRIHNIHPKSQILGDPKSAVQTRSKVQQKSGAHALISYIQKQQRNNHKDQQHCLFACFLSQEEPKKISEALQDDSWVQAMQEELLQFRLQQVWILVDLPHGAKVIGTKWVYRNKRDERGVVVRNKARLVNKANWPKGTRRKRVLTMMRFLLLWQEWKLSDEEVYVSQPPGFVDPDHPKKVYKVVKALYGLHQAPRAWDKKDIMLVQVYVDDIIFGSTKKSWCDEFEALMKSRFQMSSMAEILKKFDLVTPKTSHLNDVKRIFKYLKGKPNLGLWYPRESPFDLEAFSDSDYGGSNLDRKSTTGGCQFLGQRLISWQCKKQTIVATSTTEAEYVAAANCCGQVLWVQNQLLDYGFNFMNTKIHIDNESTICIVKNPVYHSKTKHIEIRHHFIRDCYEKKLIRVEKIHTDLNVADLLTKPFDGPRNSMDLQIAGQEAPSVHSTSTIIFCGLQPTHHLHASTLYHLKPQTIPPLFNLAPTYDLLLKTTTASPSPSPSTCTWNHGAYNQLHQQPPIPRHEATLTFQLMTRIGDLDKQLRIPNRPLGKACILIWWTGVNGLLEVALKRKTKRVLLSNSEEEETEAHGRKTQVKSAFEKVNTGGIRVSVPSPDRGRREGKAPMTEEEETQASRKTKEQILQEEAGLAEAIRLDALWKKI